MEEELERIKTELMARFYQDKYKSYKGLLDLGIVDYWDFNACIFQRGQRYILQCAASREMAELCNFNLCLSREPDGLWYGLYDSGEPKSEEEIQGKFRQREMEREIERESGYR